MLMQPAAEEEVEVEEGALTMLVLHEWFPVRTFGCDVRLEAVVRQLAASGVRVSYVARSWAEPGGGSGGRQRMRALLRGRIHVAEDEAALAALLSSRVYDAALVPLWFWLDRPAAEVALPLLRRLSPLTTRVLLTDDCHALRERLLAALDPLPDEAARSAALASQLEQREAAVQRLADRIAFITEHDQETCHYATEVPALLLRAGPPEGAGAAAGAEWGAREGLVFVGNGPNPTNHLSIKHFVRRVWPLVRAQLPSVRLHLVGELPREGRACRERGVHCGWTGNDAEAEAREGLVLHGRVADLGPLLAQRRVMLAPIVNSTGVNTKCLLAFQHALPLVCSAKAAAGLALPANASAAGVLVAPDDAPPAHMAALIVAAYTRPDLWRALSAAAAAHLRFLRAHDPLAHDVRALVSSL